MVTSVRLLYATARHKKSFCCVRSLLVVGGMKTMPSSSPGSCTEVGCECVINRGSFPDSSIQLRAPERLVFYDSSRR